MLESGLPHLEQTVQASKQAEQGLRGPALMPPQCPGKQGNGGLGLDVTFEAANVVDSPYFTDREEYPSKERSLHKRQSHSEGKKKQSPKSSARHAIRTALDFWHKLNRDWLFYLAAILAYTLLMSIIPLLAVLLSILNGVLGALAPHVQQQLLNGVGKLILPPIISSELLKPAMQTASQSSDWVGIIALLVSAWIGSQLFVAIEHCFSVIFCFPKRAFVRQHLMALSMLLVFALLLPLLLAVPLGMTLLSSTIANQVLPSAASIGLWLTLTGVVASFVVASAFFLVIYLVVPNRPMRLREAGPGALIAGALLQLYNLVFPFYTTHFLPFANYGAALGLALLILLFFYYFGLILLLGAEINAFRAGQRAPARGQGSHAGPIPGHNQRGGEASPTVRQPQEDTMAGSTGLDSAVASPPMDEGQEKSQQRERHQTKSAPFCSTWCSASSS